MPAGKVRMLLFCLMRLSWSCWLLYHLEMQPAFGMPAQARSPGLCPVSPLIPGLQNELFSLERLVCHCEPVRGRDPFWMETVV